MKHFVAILILSISSMAAMDSPEGALKTFQIDTQRFPQREGISIMNSAKLAVITVEGMDRLMGEELRELQKCPPIEFHKFNQDQLELYGQSPDKIVKFEESKVFTIKSLKYDENRLIFSDNIINCVGLFIWKSGGPSAFGHLNSQDIFGGKFDRVLSKVGDKIASEDRKSFQVGLISTTYSEDVRNVYSKLKEAGFSSFRKAILDMYYDSKEMRYIALPSLDLSVRQLEEQSAQSVVDLFEEKQSKMIPYVLSATLSDGRLYDMEQARGLVNVAKNGNAKLLGEFVKKLERMEPAEAQKIIGWLKACPDEGTKLKFIEQYKL